MNIPKDKSSEIANAFVKYLETGDKSLIENFTLEEINITLLRYYQDKGWPAYEAMEKRIAELKEEKRHSINVILKIISIFLAACLLIWTIIYTLFISPPKYVINSSEQELKIDIGHGYAESKLHFVLRNKNRGEGDITKPALLITAEDSDKKYELKPRVEYTTSKKEGNNITSFTTVDLGRTIHVGPYGIVDEFFRYFVYKDEKSELFEFLKSEKDKLQFKIKGYPYKETKIENKEFID